MALSVGPVLVAVKLLAAEPVIVAVPDPVLIKEVPLLPDTMLSADVDTADPVAVEPEIVPLESTLEDVPCAVACSLAADDVVEAETETDPDAIEDELAAMDDEPDSTDEPALTVADGGTLPVED